MCEFSLFLYIFAGLWGSVCMGFFTAHLRNIALQGIKKKRTVNKFFSNLMEACNLLS